jgi:hypothetical protein
MRTYVAYFADILIFGSTKGLLARVKSQSLEVHIAMLFYISVCSDCLLLRLHVLEEVQIHASWSRG